MPDSADVIGRDAELDAAGVFLDAAGRGCRALLLEGEPGIGKTTVWSATVALARSRSFTVLLTRSGQP